MRQNCTVLSFKQWLEVMDQDQVPLHLDQHRFSHQLQLDDQAKFLTLILTSHHEKKNWHWNHHLKQLQYQENLQAWAVGYCEIECIGILASSFENAFFLIFLGTLVQRAKPHLKEANNRSIPHPYWIHPHHRHPNDFQKIITTTMSLSQKLTRISKRSSKTTWNWGLM